MNPLKRPIDRGSYLNQGQPSKAPADGRPKQSSLLQDGVIVMEQLLWQGNWYPLNKLASGTVHTVWEFSEPSSITFGQVALDTALIAIRTFRSDASVKNPGKLLKGDAENYNALVQAGVPVATVHFANDKILVVEKMAEGVNPKNWESVKSIDELSAKDRIILEFARTILRKKTDAGQNIVSDFCPRNVMLDRQGLPKIVDYAKPRLGETKSYIKDWSLGNPVIEEFLLTEPVV